MAYTTNQLISGAYYASGVVSREFEEVTGSQVSDGLIWLNEILQDKTVDQMMIPYETTYTFNGVVGQEQYTVSNLIQINTLTFTLDTVRYSMQPVSRNKYFGRTRTNNIQSLPGEYFFERGLGGGTLYMYFVPNQAYAFELHGIFSLSDVALGQDLELTVANFYINYLRYALAERICAEFNEDVPQNVARQLAKYEAYIDKSSRPMDLSMTKMSTLQQGGGMSWAVVNLGRGFSPTRF